VRTAHALAARSGARLRVLAAVRPRAWSRAGAAELREQAEKTRSKNSSIEVARAS
jgi:hypothetical protein